MEIWKSIKGYEGYYEISNKGNLKSIERKIKRRDGYYARIGERNIIPSLGKDGNLYVCLSKERKTQIIKVPELVLVNFVDDYDVRSMYYWFKDEDKENCNLKNLEYDFYGTRVGGPVIIKTRGKRDKHFINIKEAGKKIGFNYNKVINGELKPELKMTVEFDQPFEFKKKTVSYVKI